MCVGVSYRRPPKCPPPEWFPLELRLELPLPFDIPLFPPIGRLGAVLTDCDELELDRGVNVLLGRDGNVRWLLREPLNWLRLVPVARCGRTVARVLLSRFTRLSVRLPPKLALWRFWLRV